MRLERRSKTATTTTYLSRTGNFATLLADSREKYNKAPLRRGSASGPCNCAEKRPCVCALRNFSLLQPYSGRRRIVALRKVPALLSEFAFSFLRGNDVLNQIIAVSLARARARASGLKVPHGSRNSTRISNFEYLDRSTGLSPGLRSETLSKRFDESRVIINWPIVTTKSYRCLVLIG